MSMAGEQESSARGSTTENVGLDGSHSPRGNSASIGEEILLPELGITRGWLELAVECWLALLLLGHPSMNGGRFYFG